MKSENIFTHNLGHKNIKGIKSVYVPLHAIFNISKSSEQRSK
jgi:hypothetical protein